MALSRKQSLTTKSIIMKKKFLYLMLLLFIGGPILQSCGSSKRGCKKMRKYRTYSFGDNQSINFNQLNTKLS